MLGPRLPPVPTGTPEEMGLWPQNSHRTACENKADITHFIFALVTKYHYVPMIVLGLVLLAIGGLPFLLWGIFMRTVVGLHATWLVNSATHLWGSRRFSTRDRSTNNCLVALLTFGEGWHNNHHAHPTSCRHGLTWYEVDMNWYGIWTLKLLGLAKQIKVANCQS